MQNNGNSRNTVQRDLVFAAAKGLKHPTAEEVYREVASVYPNISKATVYRNLNFLADNGFLLRISSPDGADHFDRVTCRHFHALCKKCGRAFDVTLDKTFEEMIDRCVTDAYGFEIEKADLSFSGLCADCRESESDRT